MPRIARLSQDAWHCATLETVFESSFYAELELGLEAVNWSVAKHRFYVQREADLEQHTHYSSLFSPETRSEIADKIGRFFGVKIANDFSITGHKMIEGDHIGFHTDENNCGERYRLTVTFNRDWHLSNGGVFLALNRPSLRYVRDAWLPEANTGFLFEIGENSYHAVSPIKGSTSRYSIVLTFRRLDEHVTNPNRWTVFPLRDDVDDARSTAEKMGIDPRSFSGHYSCLSFVSVADFARYFSDGIENCPADFSYRSGVSMNVDQNGIQSKGSDVSRVEAISKLTRIPPIIVVRRRFATPVLVDGSHRLSHATDSGEGLNVTVFEES